MNLKKLNSLLPSMAGHWTGPKIIGGVWTVAFLLSLTFACAIENPADEDAGDATSAGAAMVIVEPSGGQTMVSEGGTPDTVDIHLAVQPEATVSIALADKNGQLMVSPATVLFTATNYKTKQTVSISAVDDMLVEGNMTGLVSVAITAGDSNYRLLSLADIAVDISDNDSAGVSLVETGGNTAVSESGSYDTYQISLTRAPTEDVRIRTLSSNANQISVTPAELTFTSSNWSVPQDVIVAAVDDPGIEDDITYKISHTISSSDLAYNGLAMGKINVTVSDNDRIVYVNRLATGLNNGQSWANAYTELSDALAAALPGQELWVAAGKYTPGGLRTSSFNLVSNLKVFGGFSGTETAKSQRDWTIYETTLSGDIAKNDSGPHTGYADNAYHILRAINVSSAVVDGFIMEGGHANSSADNQDRGGALFSINSSLTLRHLTVRANAAHDSGAGFYFINSTNVTISQSEFTDNRATDGSLGTGGAVIFANGQNLTIDQSVFTHNIAYDYSGGVHVSGSSDILFKDSTFAHNQTLTDGTAVRGSGAASYISIVENITIDGCVFSNNISADNGAVFATRADNFKIMDSEFTGNAALGANDGGGALQLWSSSRGVSIDNTTFTGNSATQEGGALYAGADDLTITNSHFENNSSDGAGGALKIDGADNITISDTSFTGNQATGNGGAIDSTASDMLTITGAQFENNSSENFGGAIGLTSDTSTTIENTDFTDNQSDSRGGALYLNTVNAFTVTGGTYSGNSTDDYGGVVYGHASSILFFNDADFSENQTLVNGASLAGSGSVGYFFDNTSLSFSNCTFSQNTAADSSALFVDDNTSLSIKDSTFSNNHSYPATVYGGAALHLDDSFFSYIGRTHFIGNSTGNDGGAIVNHSNFLSIDRSLFLGNTAQEDGGGLHHRHGSMLTVTNSVFTQNIARRGSGVFIFSEDGLTTATVSNNTVAYNYATHTGDQDGGLVQARTSGHTSTLELTNNIIHQNVGYSLDPQISNLLYIDGSTDYHFNNALSATPGHNPMSGDPMFTAGPKSVAMTGDSDDSGAFFTSGTNHMEVQACDTGVLVVGEFLEYNRDGIAREIESVSCPIVWLVAEDALPTSAQANKLLTLWGSGSPVPLDLRPDPTAAAVNGGDSSYASTGFDFAGNARVQGTTVDAGAFEIE